MVDEKRPQEVDLVLLVDDCIALEPPRDKMDDLNYTWVSLSGVAYVECSWALMNTESLTERRTKSSSLRVWVAENKRVCRFLGRYSRIASI